MCSFEFLSYSPGPFVSLTLSEHDLKHVCFNFFFLKSLHFTISLKKKVFTNCISLTFSVLISDFTIKSCFIRGFAKNIVLGILKTQPISRTFQYHHKGRRSGA